MSRLLFVCLLAVFAAGVLHGQAVGSPATGDFNTNDWHMVRIDIDHGSTPQSITVGAEVTSLSGPTFLFDLIDWDSYVLGLSNVNSRQQVMPGSSNTGQVTTPARSGVHPFMLRLANLIEPAQVVDYAFLLSLSGGSVVSYSQSDRPWISGSYPVRALEADMAATFISWGVTANLGTFVTLDFGPTPQSADVRLDCSAQGVLSIVLRWPDGAGGRGALFVDSDQNDAILSVPGVPHLATIPAQSGLVEVTVSVSALENFNYADWNLCVPGSVKVVEMHGTTTKPVPSTGSYEQVGGCTAGTGSTLPAMLAAAGGWALTSRRRKLMRK
jgi:hypothetical protein